MGCRVGMTSSYEPGPGSEAPAEEPPCGTPSRRGAVPKCFWPVFGRVARFDFGHGEPGCAFGHHAASSLASNVNRRRSSAEPMARRAFSKPLCDGAEAHLAVLANVFGMQSRGSPESMYGRAVGTRRASAKVVSYFTDFKS
mmetsp:Transcript_33274/g.114493  ORF Transcript_33274/g.114493 Transcript_33274/m.114493 type:complete len:141 (-) Transcript_33274:456-878(-)